MYWRKYMYIPFLLPWLPSPFLSPENREYLYMCMYICYTYKCTCTQYVSKSVFIHLLKWNVTLDRQRSLTSLLNLTFCSSLLSSSCFSFCLFSTSSFDNCLLVTSTSCFCRYIWVKCYLFSCQQFMPTTHATSMQCIMENGVSLPVSAYIHVKLELTWRYHIIYMYMYM